jgi:D-alanyl-D-alanine carboxypeptidase
MLGFPFDDPGEVMSMRAPVDRLRAMLDDQVENFGAVGVIVGIDVPGIDRVRVTAGVDALQGARLDPSRLFQIGSQTKTFVALAMLLLSRDGVVGLDDPVARHLALPIDPRITLRHLIMNTSGLAEYIGTVSGGPNDQMNPVALITPAIAKGPLFEPGAQFDYSNTGWVVAALVLDAKAAGGYAGFVRDRIFGPLGMTDSYVAAGYPADRLAHGYMRGADGVAMKAAEGFSLSWAYGAGDIISSCDDMLDLFRALSREYNPLGVTLADMTDTWVEPGAVPIHPASLGCTYALGLERRWWGGLESWGHPGRTVGFGASTAFMYVEDPHEPHHLAAQRYNPHLLFTQALATAHALHDGAARQRAAAPDLAVAR